MSIDPACALDVSLLSVSPTASLAAPLEVVVAGIATEESMNVNIDRISNEAGRLDVNVDAVATDCGIDVYIAGIHERAGVLTVSILGQ